MVLSVVDLILYAVKFLKNQKYFCFGKNFYVC